MRWQYMVPDNLAEKLRTAIEDEDYFTLESAFIDVCTWIQANVPDAEWDITELLEETEWWDTEWEAVDEDFEDELNYCLGELYDICDGYRIWIPI